MSLSASKMKQGGMTTLELQAQNIVKDDDSDDNVQVTDEAKYNALVESRKNRRAVSFQSTHFSISEKWLQHLNFE